MRVRLIRALFAALPTLALPAAMAQETPTAPITTDTLEYCINLQQMVVQRGSTLAEVKRLLEEGRRMCDHGEVRVGIARLRQALILSRHHLEPAAPPAEAQY